MLRRTIAAMYFWSRNPRYVLLQWIVIVFSTLTVDVNSESISGNVTITPKNIEPNTDVELECRFNLTTAQTTLLYWNDKRGDTLYFYEKGKNISLGPEYKTSVKNVETNSGHHKLTLRVTGCNNSPYKCDIWMDSTEHIIQESLVIKLLAAPAVLSDGNIVHGDIDLQYNASYTLACKVPEATMEHNLTMEIKINGNQTKDLPAPRASSYNSTTCLYSCSLQKDYTLWTSDEVEVKCTARYKDGTVKVTTTTTPGMGESKMLDMPIIIIIVVVAVIIIIVIVTLAIVMCVKKKKALTKIFPLACTICRPDQIATKSNKDSENPIIDDVDGNNRAEKSPVRLEVISKPDVVITDQRNKKNVRPEASVIPMPHLPSQSTKNVCPVEDVSPTLRHSGETGRKLPPLEPEGGQQKKKKKKRKKRTSNDPSRNSDDQSYPRDL